MHALFAQATNEKWGGKWKRKSEGKDPRIQKLGQTNVAHIRDNTSTIQEDVNCGKWRHSIPFLLSPTWKPQSHGSRHLPMLQHTCRHLHSALFHDHTWPFRSYCLEKDLHYNAETTDCWQTDTTDCWQTDTTDCWQTFAGRLTPLTDWHCWHHLENIKYYW